MSTSSFIEGIRKISQDGHFRILAENLPLYLVVIDSENYLIQYLNHVQPGFKLEEVIARPVFDFVSPEHREQYKEKMEETKRTGKTTTIDIVGENKYHPSGKGWYRTYISSLKSGNNVEALLLLSEDVTEIKWREIESFNKQEKLKAVINNTNDIICSIDREYNLMEFNSVFSKIVKDSFNIELKEGMPVLDFINPALHEKYKSYYERVFKKGESILDIVAHDLSNGNKWYMETRYNPIYDYVNKITGISIFSKDITEQVESKQNLEKALKEKDILLTEIHHRIKNNLAVISGMLQLQELNVNSNELKEVLSNSRKRIKAAALIHESLYKHESFEGIDLLQYIIDLHELLNEDKKFMLEISGNEVQLKLEKALSLGMIMNELFMNSIKHSFNGLSAGRTRIDVKKSNNNLIIEYCDCSGEFPLELDINKPETTGLTLIHTLVEQLNGEIQLVSHNPPKFLMTIHEYQE